MADENQDLLLFVAANEVVLAEQAAALLEITDEDATGRLERFGAERLVTRVHLSSQLPPAYRITRAGAEQTDSFLPPLRALDMGGYRHEIAIAWLWASARHGQLGDLREVLSRREMQAADATLRSESLLDTPGAKFSSSPVGGTATDARHAYPDLGLVQAAGGWVTLDVVLSLPNPGHLRTMLGRYRHDRLMLAQLYLTEQDQQIEDAITAAAEDLGVSDRVHVQRLAHNGIAGA
jgi:hypothetical protein